MQEVLPPYRGRGFQKATTPPSQVSTIRANINRYEVTPDLETGNDLIDSEHRTLFDAINDLMDACSSGQGRSKIGETADFLADYVDKHFADEEDLQRQNHYPHYQSHHNFHVNYKQKIRELADEIRVDGPSVKNLGEINSQASVLINHIRHEDKRLAEFIKSGAKQ